MRISDWSSDVCSSDLKSSPKIYQALCSGEQLKTVDLEFYRISPKGTEEKYYTIHLEKAVIVSTRLWVPNCLHPDNRQMGHMEDVGMKIGRASCRERVCQYV